MKNLSFLLCVFAFLFSACKKEKAVVTVDCVPTSLQSNLIAFYPFSNGNLEDKSNFTNDLTNVSQATATIDRNGNLNCAYRFDNRGTTEQFLTTTQTDFLNNLSSFSISMWYQPIDSTRAVGDFESLLVRGDNRRCPNRGGEWSVGLYDCRKAVFGHNNSVWANAISMNGGCQGEVETLTGNWHHVVAVKSNDTYKIYFNQNLDETDTGDANCGSAFIAAADIGDLFVGRMYTGDIDDIMIFNKELSQQEVTELFNLDTCCD